MSATKVAFTIDIESRGDDAMRNGIVSIGVCVGRLDRIEVLHRQRFDLKPLKHLEYLRILELAMVDDSISPEDAKRMLLRLRPSDQEFEERCMDQFWSKNMDKLTTMEKDAIDAVVGIGQFRALLDKWDDKKKWVAVIVSDNVGYDCRVIDHYLSVAGLKSLQYGSAGDYRPNYDSDSYARGVERLTYDDMWVNDAELISKYNLDVDKSAHDHMPENDADVIYRMHVGLMLSQTK